MHKTVSIWLILNDGANKGKIASQRRFTNNSSPYICQPTWNGKIEEGENEMDAVLRECKEELGEGFYNNFVFSEIKLLEKNNFVKDSDEWEVNNYLGNISEELLKTVKMHGEAFNDFVFIGKDDKVYPKNSGKDPQKNRVMFDDQFETLNKILNGA